MWQAIFVSGPKSDLPKEVIDYEKSLGLDPYDAAAQIWGDVYFGGPAYFAAQKRSKDDLDTYLYLFSRAVPADRQTLGATHALELAYLFGSFFPFVARNEWDDRLSEIMISDWTNFAKFGVPRGNWPKFSQSKPIAKIYGDKVYEGKLDNSEVFEALAENIDQNL